MNNLFMHARAGGKSTLMSEIWKLASICKTGRKDNNKLGKRKREMYCGAFTIIGANPERAIREIRPSFMIIDDIESTQQ